LQSSSIWSLARMPRNPRTMILKDKIQPTLIKTLCCCTCFCLYPYAANGPPPPTFCTYTPFPTDQLCNKELWVQKLAHWAVKDLGQFPKTISTGRLILGA
jgi:hypothetical protein